MYTQIDNYYLSFPDDPNHMKGLVYSCLALELAQTLMVTRDTYLVFAAGYGDLLALDHLHLLWLTLPILGGIGQQVLLLNNMPTDILLLDSWPAVPSHIRLAHFTIIRVENCRRGNRCCESLTDPVTVWRSVDLTKALTFDM